LKKKTRIPNSFLIRATVVGWNVGEEEGSLRKKKKYMTED
jgi:hypothetical protein